MAIASGIEQKLLKRHPGAAPGPSGFVPSLVVVVGVRRVVRLSGSECPRDCVGLFSEYLRAVFWGSAGVRRLLWPAARPGAAAGAPAVASGSGGRQLQGARRGSPSRTATCRVVASSGRGATRAAWAAPPARVELGAVAFHARRRRAFFIQILTICSPEAIHHIGEPLRRASSAAWPGHRFPPATAR